MVAIYMSWTVGIGKDCHGSTQKAPAWTEVEQKLNEIIEKRSGTITVDFTEMADRESCSLQVLVENGNYILLFNKDDDVRTFTNIDMDGKPIEVLGDLWDSRLVCQDFNLVLKTFKEFYENKDVSQEILN